MCVYAIETVNCGLMLSFGMFSDCCIRVVMCGYGSESSI